MLNPINLETLGSQDFRKAACCSLSESFQGTNTVDLTYTNAATGNREIQFLGLRGLYTQNLIENRPVFGGILSSQSYDYIPGTWLDQINILKGAGTSIYGIESITGAINTSLKKPETDHRFFANVYADGHERAEVNLHLNHSWNIKQHSGIYAHYSQHQGGRDHNKDGFYDDPLQNKWNVIQRNTLLGTKFEGHLQISSFWR
ncbi:MAG: Plug domain-containing protein [Saprospiraceae bacterium]|nr:Plug domain-containing protein [Saprospiraceae bacterium]